MPPRNLLFSNPLTYLAEVLIATALAARAGWEEWISSMKWGQDEKCTTTHLECGPLYRKSEPLNEKILIEIMK